MTRRLTGIVVTRQQHSWELAWDRTVSFLLVDGLHDYASVARDFDHFEPWLATGSYVAFHDFADYFPGVRRFVREVLASGRYTEVAVVGSMILLRKVAETAPRERSPGPVVDRAPPSAAPLVSCVMATYDRPHLVPQAVASFLRQTHPAIELLVVDDGPESLAPALPDDPRIRHIRLDRRRTIGAKRNIGCEAARGEILANWDDDDWYAPRRIAYQVQELVASGADVSGLNTLLYFRPEGRRAWRYRWPTSSRPWVHDAVLIFSRELWRRNPFPDTNMGIDCRMLWTSVPKQVHVAADESIYVGMVHGANTSPKNVQHGQWTAVPVEEVEALLGDDLEFFCQAFVPAARTPSPHGAGAGGGVAAGSGA